ncbi:Rrf2 family transcriptional regulator [Stappia sp.]|uniref:RrF2 family transcriptional regulator n=1 Tax=Stappia sp. TaxID=1870903 RepID=UPI0032D931F0
MRLTNRTDIAVRTLMYLAISKDRIIPVDEIVEQTASHRSQVVAAVQKLRKAGYIKSTVGRSGGVMLAKQPDDIDISSIVKLIETDFALAECLEDQCPVRCGFQSACRFRTALDGALAAFLDYLEGVTIADLVADRDGLLRALSNNRQRLALETHQ